MQTREVSASGFSRLAAALEANAPAVWDYDLATGVLLASEGLKALLGIHRQGSLEPRDFLAAVHPDDRALFADLFAGRLTAPPSPVRFSAVSSAGDRLWLRATIITNAGAEGVTSITGTLVDLSEIREATHALAESEERLRLAIEAGRMAVWEVDMASGRITNSPELNILLGLPINAVPTLEDVRALYAPGELDRLDREGFTYERVRERTRGGAAAVRRDWTQKPASGRTQIQAEFSIITPAGEPKQLLLRAQHAPALDGVGQRVTGVLVDITDRKLAEERLSMVARELQHRVKNSLAVVQALATQSFRAGIEPARAKEAFAGRLSALVAATDAVLDAGISHTSLLEIVTRILAPYRDAYQDPFHIAGPDILLSGRLAAALGMALHELCTNAVKYGALSVAGGRVAVDWTRSSAGLIELTWVESGGPPVVRPERCGFGTRLLQSLIPDGGVRIEYRVEGVRCTISTLHHAQDPVPASG